MSNYPNCPVSADLPLRLASAPLETNSSYIGASAGLGRRAFLKSTALAAGLTVLELEASAAEAPSNTPSGLVDVNVSLFRWPCRRVAGDETRVLAARLRAQGVSQAWAGSLEGLLHKDLAAVNERLIVECRQQGRGLLVPFASVNPMLPDWEDDLRRCAEVHRVRGVRLHPNYHGYKLSDPVFARLLRRATERGLIVQLALLMEDERMMHPLLRVPPVDPAPLLELVKATAGLRLVLLNALQALRGEALARLVEAGDVYVEIATLEGVGGVANLLQRVPVSRVLFGSHAPLFYFESAALKLKESPLSAGQLQALRTQNARRLLSRLTPTPQCGAARTGIATWFPAV
jgi:predicted TIM-barrel fold metal-dependent hydrolase